VDNIADSGHENTLGLYNVLVKQVVAWNQPDVQELWDTLRHEVAHRYLDLAIGHRPPRWLNEGLAETFAACWNTEGKFAAGRMRKRALATFLRSPNLLDISSFVVQPQEEFLKKAEIGYAQAWALVHFLRFEEDQRIYDRLMTDLEQGANPLLALEQNLAVLDRGDFNKRFLAWLNASLSEFQRK